MITWKFNWYSDCLGMNYDCNYINWSYIDPDSLSYDKGTVLGPFPAKNMETATEGWDKRV